MQVPAMSLVTMTAAMAVSIGLPVVLLVWLCKRRGAQLIPAVAGAFVFPLFALVLEGVMHRVVLSPDPVTGAIALKDTPLLFILYGAFAAGVFEETGRFVSFQILKKRYNGMRTALSYGVGHGGIESIMLCGLVMVNNLVLCAMINLGQIKSVTDSLQGAALAQMNAAVETLTTVSPWMFLIAGGERVMAIAVHIALSVLVWRSVGRGGRWWLFPAAIALHALVDVPAAAMQAGVLTSVALVELATLAIIAAVVGLAYPVYKNAVKTAQ